MEDDALIYEHLVCKAFNCGRFGIWFANADIYRGACTEEKQKSLKEYILISIKVILLYKQDKFRKEVLAVFEDCYNKFDKDEIKADEAIEMLKECYL